MAEAHFIEAEAAHQKARKFIREVSQLLAKQGEIPRDSLRPIAAQVLGVTDDNGPIDELVDAVLRTNVFALHPASRTVTFQSRAMRTYLLSTLIISAPPSCGMPLRDRVSKW
jgi:hypothetical protein